ncbi:MULTISPECIES: hypothetical protein [unclassified Streptomyces]|uniref:hypothetical protein n=1 Tax=unclassified Streptomyces TaxID=2593676 RepID=UPI0035D7968B
MAARRPHAGSGYRSGPGEDVAATVVLAEDGEHVGQPTREVDGSLRVLPPESR